MNNERKRLRGQRGFTIIEVLATLVVVSVVGAATTVSLVTTTNLVGENSRASRAVTIAQETLEDLRTLPYSEIADDSITVDGYDVVWEVTEDPILTDGGSSEDGMKLIHVTVSWTWKGAQRTYELDTVYSSISPE